MYCPMQKSEARVKLLHIANAGPTAACPVSLFNAMSGRGQGVQGPAGFDVKRIVAVGRLLARL